MTLRQAAQEELREHMQRGTRMAIYVDLQHASAVAALLSLALKHPEIRSTPAAMAIGKTLIEAVIASLEQLGAANMASMLRKGEEQPGFTAEPSANPAQPASGAQAQASAATTADERVRVMIAALEEIVAMRDRGRVLSFALDSNTLVAMLGAVQAAIRSPVIATPAGVDAACRHGTELIAQTCEAAGAPNLAASIRAGWDSTWDGVILAEPQPASGAVGTSERREGAAGAPSANVIYTQKVLQARNLLIEAFAVHDQACQVNDCREKGNTLGFLAHCLGADEHDLRAMRKALLEYDLACSAKCPRPPG
jgi:hypothetical protein